jgi:hypothetical protein
MKLGRLAFAAAAAIVGFGADALAGNGSNFMALQNGADFYYGGFFNPQAPVGTHGAWRCFPGDQLHAPTMTIDPAGTVAPGNYATKICAIHWIVLTSTGKTAVWPNVVLSSSDGDCRVAPGGTLNYGFASSSAIGIPGGGIFGFGPLNSTSGLVNLLAWIGNVTFVNPFPLGTAVGLQLNMQPVFGSPSTIAVPEGESLVYWMSENPAEAAGSYQYYVGSLDERGICSSLSFLASAIGTPSGAVFAGLGAAFGFAAPQFEHGMWLGTKDASFTAAVAVSVTDLGIANTHKTGANPIDIGTGGRTLSLTGVTPEGGNGLGFDTMSMHSNDENNAFGGSNRLHFANLSAVNLSAVANCGPWTPGYFAVPTGGAGGPALSGAIPQNPRIVGKLDAIALSLIANPVWVLSTTHADATGGAEYPAFPGFPVLGGSSGNTGGFAIPVPNLPQLVGVELFLSTVGLNAAGTSIAANANNGHSHSNGHPLKFHP